MLATFTSGQKILLAHMECQLVNNGLEEKMCSDLASLFTDQVWLLDIQHLLTLFKGM